MNEAVEAKEVSAGFRQTQLGPRTITVPEHWSRTRIKDVSEVVTRGKQPTYVDEPGVPVLNQSCIYWDGYYPENLKYLDRDVADDWKPKHFATKGDILINSTGQGTLGRTLYWDKELGTHAIDSHITRVSVDSDTIDPEFLRYYLESTWGQTMLYVFCVAGSTGQVELSKSDLMSMPLLVPPVEEQRRIADILSTVDEQIQQTDEIIEETKELHRGIAQQLLDRGIRNEPKKEVEIGPLSIPLPESWELRRLENFPTPISSVVQTGPYGSKLQKDEFTDTGYKVYRQANINSVDFDEGDQYVTEAKYRDLEKYHVRSGDVLLTRMGTIGDAAVLPESAKDGIMDYHLFRIRIDPSFCLPEYLGEVLRSSRIVKHQIESFSHGAIMDGLNTGLINELCIPVPPIEEQREVVDVLSIIDHSKSLDQKRKTQLKQLKRGLMQDLLTGKTRVNPDN